MKWIGLSVFLVFLLQGCTVVRGGLYWGDYSETLYNYKKEPSEKTRKAHKKSLLDIIEYSNKKQLRIPPGVYAELGKMEFEDGNKEQGRLYIQREMELYPESTTMMTLVLASQAG